jgi:hypothetical protein
LQGLTGFEQRQGVGFFALETVAAKHLRKVRRKPFGGHQGLRKRQRLVGQARQGQSHGLELRQALHHPRKDLRKLAVDGQVMVFVAGPHRGEQGLHLAGVTGHASLRQLVAQHRADQVLRAFADRALNEGAAGGGHLQVGQGPVQGRFKVTNGVDHGAVQVDHDGLQLE